MERTIISGWKGKLLSAEVLLTEPAAARGPRATQRTLIDMLSALRSAIAHVEDLESQMIHAREIVRETADQRDSLLRVLPIPIVLTLDDGEIFEVNLEAEHLFNGTGRSLCGKSVLLYLEDRPAVADGLRMLREPDAELRRPVVFRPKERAARHLAVTVRRMGDGLCWMFLPNEAG